MGRILPRAGVFSCNSAHLLLAQDRLHRLFNPDSMQLLYLLTAYISPFTFYLTDTHCWFSHSCAHSFMPCIIPGYSFICFLFSLKKKSFLYIHPIFPKSTSLEWTKVTTEKEMDRLSGLLQKGSEDTRMSQEVSGPCRTSWSIGEW